MDKRIMMLMVLFFLSFSLFATLVVFNEPISKFTRASGKYTAVSPSSSKIIFWPQTVKADGESSSTIQVFLVSLNDTPITNKKVTLNTTLGRVLEGELSQTEEGKRYYVFHLVSDQEGEAEVSIKVEDSTVLNQKISVKFIN